MSPYESLTLLLNALTLLLIDLSAEIYIWEKAMSVFVNRNREMQLIEESFQTLLDEDRLLRKPILDFYGVSGIGKTLLLEQIKARCHATRLPYIWIDFAGKKGTFQGKVVEQVKG